MTWHIHGVSVEGYRHRQSGTPCQDAWDHTPAGTPVTVLAVADGAGSRPRSGEGSRLAVELSTSTFARRLAGRPAAHTVAGLMLDAFRDVREEFLKQTIKTGDHPDDFATTLTVVVLAQGLLGYLSVGDGFAVVRAGNEDGERQFHLLPQPESISEYSNETIFVTSSEAERWAAAACVVDTGIDGVLLSTDGLAQAALSWSGGQPVRPNASFAASVLRSLETSGGGRAEADKALAALLRSDKLTRVNADDKTLLRAVRR